MKHVSMAAICFLALAGCGSDASRKQAFIYVIDYSASTKAERRKEIGTVVAELETAPQGSKLCILRMGSDTQEVEEPKVEDTDPDSISETILRETLSSDPVGGTNFARMAQAVERVCDRYRDYTVNIRVLTDGADDFTGDPANRRDYTKAARDVATRANLGSLTFIGVKPPYRADIRKLFGEAKERLSIVTAEEGL